MDWWIWLIIIIGIIFIITNPFTLSAAIGIYVSGLMIAILSKGKFEPDMLLSWYYFRPKEKLWLA